MKHLVAVAIVLGACGTAVDDRPQTLEYVVEAITRPYCSTAQCHSTFTAAGPVIGDVKIPYSFDTVENSKVSMPTAIACDSSNVCDADGSLLYQVLIRSAVDGKFPRMPYDQPLPDVDKELIKNWINNGADGLVFQ